MTTSSCQKPIRSLPVLPTAVPAHPGAGTAGGGGGITGPRSLAAVEMLRISVTDVCNLRCVYCMPEEGLPAIPRENLLTAAEIVRLVGIGVHLLGIEEVRFTGGEPLMRRDLEEIIAGCAEVAPGTPLAVTTNAVAPS